MSIEDKLKLLNNINEELDYFNMDYIDRYINYMNNNKDLDIKEIIIRVNSGLDYEFYTNTEQSKYLNEIYVIANKHYYLGMDYVPDNLVELPKEYSRGGYMVDVARDAFVMMCEAAKKEGLTIRSMSPYRSGERQKELYDKYVMEDGKEVADTYSSRPGYSDHQTGLTTDVDNVSTYYEDFGSTKEYLWMKDNSYKFGFIERYTKGKEYITGYIAEPWHYRYVGKDIAEYIYKNKISYEEYYEMFINNKK